MKIKFLTLFIIAISFLFIFSMEVLAVNDNDSLKIDSDEAAKFKYNSDDIIIKIYNGSYMHGFAEKATIDELITSKYVGEPYYYVLSKSEGYQYKVERKGEIGNIDISDWNKLYKITLSPLNILKTISSDIQVQNVYCLDGNPSHDGVYMYFITNKGYYVYYKEYVSAENEYLLPIEKFYDFAIAVYTERKKNSDLGLVGGTKPIEEIFDLEPYKIKNTGTLLNVILWSALSFVLIFALGAVVFIYKKRVKRI